MANKSFGPRMQALAEKKLYRGNYMDMLHEDKSLVNNGLLQTMLSPAAELDCTAARARQLAALQRGVDREAVQINCSLAETRARKRALDESRTASRQAASEGERDSDVRDFAGGPVDREVALTPEEKAHLFMKKLKGGQNSEESPNIIALNARRAADFAVVKERMSRSGEYPRMLNLRAQKTLDPIEAEVLARLEAKFQGTMYAVEKERRAGEKEAKRQARRDRVAVVMLLTEERRANDALKKEARLEQLLGPLRGVVRSARRGLRRLMARTGHRADADKTILVKAARPYVAEHGDVHVGAEYDAAPPQTDDAPQNDGEDDPPASASARIFFKSRLMRGSAAPPATAPAASAAPDPPPAQFDDEASLGEASLEGVLSAAARRTQARWFRRRSGPVPAFLDPLAGAAAPLPPRGGPAQPESLPSRSAFPSLAKLGRGAVAPRPSSPATTTTPVLSTTTPVLEMHLPAADGEPLANPRRSTEVYSVLATESHCV
ncbi:hypothetical protein M885DRAFT_591580 [Pelagophyceae sp. CCMP2097]|nr:hypothetical protein M885DRAFT_591580 [Pelagophyceae sp. CCMP2097]